MELKKLKSFNLQHGDVVEARWTRRIAKTEPAELWEFHGKDEEGYYLLRRYIPGVGPIEEVNRIHPEESFTASTSFKYECAFDAVVRLKDRPLADQERFRTKPSS